MIKKCLSTTLLFLLTMLASAQENMSNAPKMADTFRAEGKIYVVITVIAIIFIALIVFLILLERNLKKLEKQINKH